MDKTTGYKMGGGEVDATRSECLAKAVTGGEGGPRYWVKKGTAGPEAGRLFNPTSSTFEPASVNRVHGATGREQYQFSKVNEACFQAYIRFLQTGNVLHLRHAERELA